MKKNCIIIPIYKETPNLLDKLSLNSLSKNLKDFSNYEQWYEYNFNGRMIHYKDSNGFEYWY